VRVVVTGATGNVGAALLDALAADPAVTDVIGVSRRPRTSAAGKARFVEANVADDDLTPHFEGADAVVHLAWQFQPTHRPNETWCANVVGSSRVFDAVDRAHVPVLVYASSVGAYSPGPGRRVDESWPTNSMPTAGYGREKAYVERALDAFEGRHPDVRVVRLRPAFIFQERAATEQRRIFAGPFVPNWVVRRGLLPAIPVPDGLRFQALSARDAAEAYRLAVMRGDARGAFNIAAVALAWKAHLIPTEPALLDLVLSLPELDCTRARTQLGWQPSDSAVEAMQSLLEGFARGAGGTSDPLEPDSMRGRMEEVRTGVGERNTV
jgi:UDP-glucose 4-epimerase